MTRARPKRNVPADGTMDAGARILAGLARGRQIAIQRAKDTASRNIALILPLVNADIAAGHPLRGRAGRICRKLKGGLTERGVKRILDRLSVGPIH